ncbi:MAG TPA: hypothetical protein PLA85_00580 [Micropepsaceae bacterium]|nr:hypothetical protein [Micropepsaceae bacterium]
MRAFLALIFAGLALAALTPAALGESKRMRFINETDVSLVRLYVSNALADEWGEDVLRGPEVRPGQSVVLAVGDDSGACMFDIKALYADGNETIAYGIDICATDYLTLTP